MDEPMESHIPPTFSVAEYVHFIKERGYTNGREFLFDEMVDMMPKVIKRFSNDMFAKSILAHTYGELLAKDFREWIRSQMDESLEYEDGGASIEVYELEEAAMFAEAMGEPVG